MADVWRISGRYIADMPQFNGRYSVILRYISSRFEAREDDKRNLIISLIVLKYTQSNSVCFVDGIKRADCDNAIDVYIGEEYMDVLAEGKWQNIFKVKPEVFTRAKKSGVTVIAQPGGSVRDDLVIKAADDYGMVMAFNGIRLFHH